MRERRRRLWAYPFFGLTDEYKVHLHELILDLKFHGTIEYFAIYEMPVQYRTFYAKKLSNIMEKRRRDMENTGKHDAPSSKVAKGPPLNKH